MRHYSGLALLLPLLIMLTAADKPKPKSNPDHLPGDEPDYYICQLGSYHKCECPAMVQEHFESEDAKCLEQSRGDTKAYRQCMSKVVLNPCDIVKEKDTAHPQHTCKRTCKTARCKCHDGPMCRAPSLVEYENGDSEP